MESILSVIEISIQVSWKPFLLTCIMITLSPSVHCEVSCPARSIERNGYCYKLYYERLPWQLAASHCENAGGFLTSIVNRQENDFLVESFSDRTSLAWIGMDSTGSWLDGSSSQMFYNNFRYETLNTSQCSVIDLEGSWNVSSCRNSKLNFICKKTKGVSGGRDWSEDNGSTTGDEEGDSQSSHGPSVIRIVIVIGVITVVAVFGKLGLYFCSHIIDCLVHTYRCIYRSMRCMRSCLSHGFSVLGCSLQSCFYSCLGRLGIRKSRQERREGTTSIDPETQEPLNRATPTAPQVYSDVTSASLHPSPQIRRPLGQISLDPISSDRHNHPRTMRTAPTPSPPACEDLPAPPSYAEALDTAFDIPPTNNDAAPSYDSVVRS